MNLRAKLVFSIALMGLPCLMLPGSVRADTVYTYTGNPYDECSGAYCTTGGKPIPAAMSVTFHVRAGTPLTNLGFVDISSDVTMFSFSDGVSGTITQSNACLLCAGGKTFLISTDAGGHITTWAMSTKTGMVAPFVVYDAGGSYLTNPPQVFDFTNTATTTSRVFGGDDRFGAPGVWTGGAAPIPEPETYAMLLAGLGLLGFAARRRKNLAA